MKTDEQLRKILEVEIKRAGSLRQWLLDLPDDKRMTKALVGIALYSSDPFPPKVANALGYRRVISWVKQD